uniref:Uncharacterized protein n=1 Tax=Timema monikensis TaxID=170555 RepID=A0A7R9EDD5_9NEOP|nr:unnamed protein product [Timema monikensis]
MLSSTAEDGEIEVRILVGLHPHRMDGKALPVKVKSEDNLEYLQQEVKLEIKVGD